MFNKLLQLLDWIYEKKCYFCNKTSKEIMCAKCFQKIQLRPLVPYKIVGVHKIFCATFYEEEMKKLLRGLKYHNQKEFAHYAALILKNYFEQLPKEFSYEVVPMPLHKTRQKRRGYNQSELIAREFASYFDFEVNTQLVRRIKNTPPLYKLNKKQREATLDGAFEYMGTNYSGRPVLIIDDIATSGTSCFELIKEFERHGVYDITVLTCACVHSD